MNKQINISKRIIKFVTLSNSVSRQSFLLDSSTVQQHTSCKTSEACYILHIYKYFLNHHIIGQVVPLRMKALACVLLPVGVKQNEQSLEIPVL